MQKCKMQNTLQCFTAHSVQHKGSRYKGSRYKGSRYKGSRYTGGQRVQCSFRRIEPCCLKNAEAINITNSNLFATQIKFQFFANRCKKPRYVLSKHISIDLRGKMSKKLKKTMAFRLWYALLGYSYIYWRQI